MKRAEKYVFYDSPLGRFAVEFFRGNAFLHLTMKGGSLDAMRAVRERAPHILAVLRKLRCRHIYAYNREGDAIWPRFMARFGFMEVRRKNGWILMEAPNG